MEITPEIRSKLHWAKDNEKPFYIKTHAFMPEAQVYIDELLREFLDGIGLPEALDQLSYCIKELAVNAKKANTKRIYFEEKSLNIHDPKDYIQGMNRFKHDTLSHQHHYIQKLKERDYYVKIEFLRFHGVCSVAVRNNVEILPGEKERIQEKVRQAGKYDNLEDAFAEVMDESEGAGLGILVLILMLKNLGFSGDFFQVYTREGETVARIILPLGLELPAV